MNKKGIIALALSTCVAVAVGTAGCGDGGGSNGKEITFYMDITTATRPIYEKLVSTYNKGQGVEDGVTVKGSPKAGISDKYNSALTSNVPDVLMAGDGIFRKVVTDLSYGDELVYNMTEFYNTMPGTLDLDDMPSGIVNKFRMTQAKGNEKYSVAGYGQDIYGIPMIDEATVLYYNEGYFKKMGINIISVAENELDGTGTYAKVMPHGYAEYKEEPFAGAVKSKNLAGKDVYMVFNNRIPMNWSEYEYVLKMFTPEYNSAQLKAKGLSKVRFGGNSEWWFNLGWSVGGDCVGWNGTSYDFTLADDSDNYIVTTKSVTLNDIVYKAGDIVHYEDKVNTESSVLEGYVSDKSLTVLPSQRDALVKYLQLNVATDKNVTNALKGYGVMSERDERSSQFSRGEIAILKEQQDELRTQKTVLKSDVNVAPCEQYRSYGEDTYTEGGTDFAHTYLKVIGETYAEEKYTGRIEEVNGVKVVGNTQTHSTTTALIMPKRADEAKRQSAWKFIRWVCGPEGQAILKDSDLWTVVNSKVAFGNAETVKAYNAYAFAFATQGGEIYDQSYFKSGEWVTNWSNEFNQTLRKGGETLEKFLQNKEAVAKNDVKTIDIIVKGNR